MIGLKQQMVSVYSKYVTETENTNPDDSKLEYTKKCLTDLASRTLDTATYLKYKKDISQCSSADKLEVIGVSLIKLIFI